MFVRPRKLIKLNHVILPKQLLLISAYQFHEGYCTAKLPPSEKQVRPQSKCAVCAKQQKIKFVKLAFDLKIFEGISHKLNF
jgi:hypothetical protein